MSDRPTLTTELAYAGWHEHIFRGRLLFAELAGTTDYWNLLSLGLGGPTVDEESAKVLNLVTVALSAAYASLPPMKLIRLVASYGHALPALGAGLAYHEDGFIVVTVPARAGEQLRSLADELGSEAGDATAVERAIEARLSRGVRLLGFGIPGRPVDERVVGFERALEKLGRHKGTHWRLLKRVERAVAKLRGWPMNITIAIAAACMDLGFSPQQLGIITAAGAVPGFAGNAVEGARQAPECLRALPEEWVSFEGRAPRPSPRATSPRG